MRNNLAQENRESALTYLLNFIFVPSSFLKLAHKVRLKERETYRSSRFNTICDKIMRLPYPQALILEGVRLYGYYSLIDNLFNK